MKQSDRYMRTESRLLFSMPIIDQGVEYMDMEEGIDKTRSSDDVFHTVSENDRIDILAWRYLGDARHWWVIAEYNDIEMPLELEPGTVLRIPSRKRLQMILLRGGRP